MLFLGFITAVGGGTIRDIIISSNVFWTTDTIYLYLVFAATLITFFLKEINEKYSRFLLSLDTLGLALFVINGTQKTLDLGHKLEIAVIMGVISGVLGGVLRSLFNTEISIIFKKEVYASVAVLTSLIYIALARVDLSSAWCTFISIMVCFIMRYTAIKFNLHLPKAR